MAPSKTLRISDGEQRPSRCCTLSPSLPATFCTRLQKAGLAGREHSVTRVSRIAGQGAHLIYSAASRKARVSPITASETPGGGDISIKVVATLPASRSAAAVGLAGREGSRRRGRATFVGTVAGRLFGSLGGLGPGFSPPSDQSALALRPVPLCTVPGRGAAAYGFAGARLPTGQVPGRSPALVLQLLPILGLVLWVQQVFRLRIGNQT